MFAATVDVAHPPETMFRYLVDPRNRPEWQSSLLSVKLHDRGEPRVGTTWRDNTLAGVRPQMEITVLEPFRVFEEVGTWRGIRARLEMRFTAHGKGCRIDVTGEVQGTGIWAAPARVAARLAPRATRHDLLRAGAVLTRRPR
ncbi:SRPBCC family protein [Nocardioides coralli]|uniref:SRPBCC family protein n=1 Tax=Nocardioides coralli TaxID=2872154 RepID=UPI001CA3AF6A|nr:SRPBCC family protein [Nocardioides coralli]QZY28857.1 SRPBCC family protein [Nocardioides coralli]